MNPAMILEWIKIGTDLIDLGAQLIQKRTGKPLDQLTTDDMLAEIAAARASITNSGQVFDAARGDLP